MERDLLAHLPVVVAVARRGGFAAAAADLGMSPSAVSHAVALVERRIALPLFARTTRSVSLTEAGAALLATLGPALDGIAEGVERLRAARGQVTGLLRLNVPRIAQPLIMTPVLTELARRHPGLTVESYGDESLTDIVAAGFDAGIRLGEMVAQDMVAVRLTPPFRTVVVASPSYLAARGRPATIADLAAHACIGQRLIHAGSLYRWELRAEDGRDVAVSIAGTAIVNDAPYARELALAGLGLAYLFAPLVSADIAAGRLEEVLPQAAIEEPGLFLYFPRGAAAAPKLRAFIEVARELAAGSA
jgi:DNA-binding transcriptional LysR family regulator